MKRWISKDTVLTRIGLALVIGMLFLGICASMRHARPQTADLNPASALTAMPANTAAADVPKPKASVTETRIETTEEPVPYDTTQTYDGTLAKNTTVVRVDGVNGKKVVKTEVKLKDGQEISRALISEEITVPPVTKIVAIGTKAVPKDQHPGDNQCDPHYTPCVHKTGHDLDCADIGFRVHIVTPGDDPYDLDVNHDGVGCEDYPEL